MQNNWYQSLPNRICTISFIVLPLHIDLYLIQRKGTLLRNIKTTGCLNDFAFASIRFLSFYLDYM